MKPNAAEFVLSRRGLGAAAASVLLAGCAQEPVASPGAESPGAGSASAGLPSPGTPTAPSASGSTAGATASTPPAVRGTPGASLLDVAYAGDDLAAHRLDLYLPTVPGPAPLVVFVHGGSWAIGHKDMTGGYGALRDALIEHGIAVASVEFRPSTVARFPAQVHDVKAAIRFLRAGASGLGLDADRFALAGDSSGAHLTQLAALTAGQTAWEGEVGTRGVPTDVRAVVSLYGVSDLAGLIADQDAAACGVNAATRAVLATLLGGAPDGSAHELAVAASPLTHVAERRTPMLLLHGTRDCVVPPVQSRRMGEALRAAGAPASVKIIDATHEDGAFYSPDMLTGTIVPFLQTYLR